ncbi:MAG: tRNA pseudouridine(13) synthase TruD [Gammaproteobacteria bacterium]|nr:tRNA pseudouridine(13) synthase TruD [Gammaproteobacteria bacterium]MDE2346442.1 tRNA pseudouridine(13) synthase TruD [Gammaproteobacteria bacterium]
MPDWALAHGVITAEARIRTTPEDFAVEEVLGFEADGQGEHLLVRVEKRSANTLWVARELARYVGIPAREVSYAGIKDRHALAMQHFSLRLGKRPTPDFTSHQHPEFRVLGCARHRRKLRIGALKGNRFRLVLRGLSVPSNSLEPKLGLMRRLGVPNYFGPQRFGRAGANIPRTAAMFSGKDPIRDRKLRGLLLSTARSLIFNALLSKRVETQSWNIPQPGEVCMLDGSHSVFAVEHVDATLLARARDCDLHPTGPLWGAGENRTSGRVALLETEVASDHAIYAGGLERAGVQAARRALRLPLRDLTWDASAPDRLMMEFFLPAGAYATAVLRELVDFTDSNEVQGDADAD